MYVCILGEQVSCFPLYTLVQEQLLRRMKNHPRLTSPTFHSHVNTAG